MKTCADIRNKGEQSSHFKCDVFYLQIVEWGRDEGWLKKTCADIRNKGVQSYIKSYVISSDC